MKRICALALCAALALSQALPVSAAKVGEVTGHALYTDIVARIDGHPLRSYNVNGHMAIVAEDLRGYGFYALWDPEARSLRVERACTQSGQIQTPETWPEYTPETLTHPVGSRAQDILYTDIVAYVAGKQVESFNIDGQTLIWFSDLAPYGAVEFDEDSRTANLTLGDPLQIQLNQMIQQMEDVKDFLSVEYQLYPRASGTLFAGSMGGTPHGSSYQLVFVRNNGTKIDILGLLPAYVGGSYFFARCRDIELDEAGTVLTFITPVKETTNWATGESKDWGDTLCTVNLAAGVMESMQPLSQPMTEWSASLASDQTAQFSQTLELTVTRKGAKVETAALQWPGDGLQVGVGRQGLYIIHTASTLLDENLQKTDYYQAYSALGQLPRVTQENFSPENTPEQRTQAARYFQVTLNGQPVSGNLWWSQGNNHVDLNFDFDEPISLSDGDVLRLWMGLPEQS